jgi:CHC2 zinc finger/Toprim-like
MATDLHCETVARAALGSPAKREGGELLWHCPRHEDRHASLSVNPTKDVWLCGPCGRSGNAWQLAAFLAGLDPGDKKGVSAWLHERGLLAPSLKRAKHSPLTVEQLAHAKGLPVEFLRELGLTDSPEGVRIAYRLMDGSLAPRHRIRSAIRAKDGSRWSEGSSEVVPYGLWRLSDARANGYLVICEGESDCWSLWYNGLPALGLPGAATAKLLRPEYLASVQKIFTSRDSDPAGERFVSTVRQRLPEIGFAGEAFTLPMPPSLKDVNDWYCGRSERFTEEILAALEAAESGARADAATPDAADPGMIYAVEDSRICWRKTTRDNATYVVPLCNFTATIEEEVILDDGCGLKRMLGIGGKLASSQTLPMARVPVERFATMNWPLEFWGHRAIVSAGMGARDRLREAIQVLSRQARERHVFTHTGWRKLDGQWAFLHAGGAVGTQGVEVELPPELRRYSLPAVPENVCEAMGVSLRLLELAPRRITVPLWCAVWRSVLASVHSIDLSLFLHGPTSGQKTTITALFLCHFGPFERLTLPANWSSTANQLEHRAFTLKDCLLAIDDFAPGPLDARELQGKAERVLRAQGNLSGRGRLASDLSERPTMPPRGLIVSTGESLPANQSLRARTLSLEVVPGDVRLGALTELQATAARLPNALSGFLLWLAPQMDGLPGVLAETFAAVRTRAYCEGTHLRLPEAVAHLWLGGNAALQFAEECGALDHGSAERLGGEVWAALVEAVKSHSNLVEGVRPSRLFLETLSALLVQGRAFLLARGTDVPRDARGEFVGWYERDGTVLLVPDLAFQSVARLCRDSGTPFPVGRERLQRDLKNEGVSRCSADRTTLDVSFGKDKRRLLCLLPDKVKELIGQDLVSVPSIPGFVGGER